MADAEPMTEQRAATDEEIARTLEHLEAGVREGYGCGDVIAGVSARSLIARIAAEREYRARIEPEMEALAMALFLSGDPRAVSDDELLADATRLIAQQRTTLEALRQRLREYATCENEDPAQCKERDLHAVFAELASMAGAHS